MPRRSSNSTSTPPSSVSITADMQQRIDNLTIEECYSWRSNPLFMGVIGRRYMSALDPLYLSLSAAIQNRCRVLEESAPPPLRRASTQPSILAPPQPRRTPRRRASASPPPRASPPPSIVAPSPPPRASPPPSIVAPPQPRRAPPRRQPTTSTTVRRRIAVTPDSTLPSTRQSNEPNSCLSFFERLVTEEKLTETKEKISALIESSLFTTITKIINALNNKYKLITENIADCEDTLTDNILKRRLKTAETKLKTLYEKDIHNITELKFYKLIINTKGDIYHDEVSSEDLTEKERNLKYIQSADFQGFDENLFKKLENQLVRLCNIYADDNTTTCLAFFKKTIDAVLTAKYLPTSVMLRPSLNYYIHHSKLAAFYVYWESFVNPNFDKEQLLLCKINKIMVRGFDNDSNPLDGIDAGGVSRDFITDVVKELKDSNIFKCLDEDDENSEGYYYVDPDFNFDDQFKASFAFINGRLSDGKRITIDDCNSEEFKINFFKFFGNLLSFLLINEFTIPFKLSTAILSTLVYPDVNVCNETYHHQFYYLCRDKPFIYTTYKDFIKDPSVINGLELYRNDMITNLYNEEENKELTDENFAEYLEKLSKYRFPEKTHPYYKAISEGFNNVVRNCLNIKLTPLSIVEKLISNTKIKMDEVVELKKAFQSNMKTKISSISSDPEKQITREVAGYITIALSGPFRVKKQNDNMELLTNDEYLDFVSRLLRFWSGWNHFKQTPTLKYHIKIIDGRSTNSLPTSHTCFYQIDMPPYENLETCLDKLYMVVYNVESGIGLAGGSRRRRRPEFTMSILNKKLQKNKN